MEILTGYPTKFGECLAFTGYPGQHLDIQWCFCFFLCSTGFLRFRNNAFTGYQKITECCQLDTQLPFNKFPGFPNNSLSISLDFHTSYNVYPITDTDIFFKCNRPLLLSYVKYICECNPSGRGVVFYPEPVAMSTAFCGWSADGAGWPQTWKTWKTWKL